MDKYRFIEVYDEDGVRWIYFNRPDKLNSFNNGLMNEVIDVLEEGGYWAIIFSGRGKVFSAGIDLAELASYSDPIDSGKLFEKLSEMVNTIFSLDVPVLIALNGDAYGGGAEFLWLGDFIIAPKGVRIGWPEARWGLIPPFLPSLGRYTLGLMRSQYLAYTSGYITSEEAYKLGLVSILIESLDEISKAVDNLLNMLKNNSPDSFKSLKKYFREVKKDVITMYGVSELIRLGRDYRVIDRARRFIDQKVYPSYDWG